MLEMSTWWTHLTQWAIFDPLWRVFWRERGNAGLFKVEVEALGSKSYSQFLLYGEPLIHTDNSIDINDSFLCPCGGKLLSPG